MLLADERVWDMHVGSGTVSSMSALAMRPVMVGALGRREFAVIAAAIIPLVAVALGAADPLAHRAAVQLALWLGVAVLAAQGIRYTRLERLSPSSAIVTIGLNLAIGLALVALEVLIAH